MNVYVDEKSANNPDNCVAGEKKKKSPSRQPCAVSLTAVMMMIKMIPHTNPMILNILAFFEASIAPDGSPAVFALCAFLERTQWENHSYLFVPSEYGVKIRVFLLSMQCKSDIPSWRKQ